MSLSKMDHGRNRPFFTMVPTESSQPNIWVPQKAPSILVLGDRQIVHPKVRSCHNFWWLTYPSEYEFVSWDDDIPNMSRESHKIPWFQTSNQMNYRASITSGSSSHSLPSFDMLNSPSNHRPQLCLSSLLLESGIQTLSNMAADVHAFASHSEPIKC